ncbi:MAG: hypothetical protein Q7R56_01975, partial [Nanoarchaeota archaeon]|nr:hypothetical protein [Nanoarchaeota archaeon]
MSSPLILKQELLKRITLFERARNAAIACDQQLTQKLARGILTEEMYVASYQQAFGKETAKFWISHYERNLKKCKKELRTCEKHLKQKQARRQHTTVIVILLLMMGLFITINPTFTGLFIGNETVINESFMNESLLNETFNETPNTTLIDTVELVNESNLTIEEVNTLNETEPPPLEENITVNTTEPELEAITNTTEETPEIIPESEEATEEITPLPEETTIIPSTIDNKEIEIQEVIAPTQVIVEQDATWIKKITVNDTVSTLTTEIPDSATAVKVMKNDQIEITDIEVQAENPAPAGNLFTGFAIFTPPSSVLENVSDNF